MSWWHSSEKPRAKFITSNGGGAKSLYLMLTVQCSWPNRTFSKDLMKQQQSLHLPFLMHISALYQSFDALDFNIDKEMS